MDHKQTPGTNGYEETRKWYCIFGNVLTGWPTDELNWNWWSIQFSMIYYESKCHAKTTYLARTICPKLWQFSHRNENIYFQLKMVPHIELWRYHVEYCSCVYWRKYDCTWGTAGRSRCEMLYGSSHGTAAVLLPGFAINQVARQLQFRDLTHISPCGLSWGGVTAAAICSESKLWRLRAAISREPQCVLDHCNCY